jgi:hypothetical protein
MKKLYNIEYELGQLREELLSMVEEEDLTLREVLDLGFNNVYINNINMYKDNEDEYRIVRYRIINKELLDAKVKYVDYELGDLFESHLEIYCKFEDEKYNDMLKKEIELV